MVRGIANRSQELRARVGASVCARLIAMLSICLAAMLVCVSLPYSAFGQEQTISQMLHTSWTGRDGAPQDVNALVQTPDGILWIGSTGGLFSFDGITFRSFRPVDGSPTLPFSPIASLLVSRDGDLWVEGIYNASVARISKGRVTVYGHIDGRSGALLTNLQQDSDGFMWAILDGSYVVRLGSDNVWHAELNPRSTSSVITGLFFDSQGTEWVFQNKRLYERPRGQTRFIATNVKSALEVNFKEDAQQGIWMFGRHHNADVQLKGLLKIARSTQDWDRAKLTSALNSFAINDVLGTTGGYLWIAIDGSGLARFRSNTALEPDPNATNSLVDRYSANDGLSSRRPTVLYQDASGNVWVGGARGLDRFTSPRLIPAIGGADEGAWSMCTNPLGEVWIANDKGDLWVLKDGQRKHVYKANAVYKLYCGRKGDVWLIDKGALVHLYKGHINRLPSLPEPASYRTQYWEFVALMELNDHEIVASEQGDTHPALWAFKVGRWKHIFPGAGSGNITAMVRQGDDIFFGGGSGEVIRVRGSSSQAFVTKPSSMGVVATLSATSKDIFALGTPGIAVFRDTSFQMLSFEQPDLAFTVSGLVEAINGDVWINGARGIVRIPSSEMNAAMKDVNHKIVGEEIHEGNFVGPATWWKPTPSAARDTFGRLWFSTLNGVVSIDPEHANPTSRLPQLSIRSIDADGLSSEKSTAFPATVQTLQIRYFGINLTDPEAVVYRYRLDGFDDNWRYVGRRSEAFYTRLKPGKYLFRVMASNGDGKWTPAVSSTMFTVLPHYYQTWWFGVLCVLLAGFLAWLGFTLRIRTVAETIRSRAEERADERIRIARELHDTLLQGVQGLLLSFHVAAQKIPADAESRKLLERAMTTADRIIIEGRDRVNSLRAEHITDAELVSTLEGVASDLAETQPIRSLVTRRGVVAVLQAHVADEVFYIAREALTNAYRHSGASQINVDLVYARRSFSMICQDDGKGFDGEAMQGRPAAGHWGMRGMAERAEKLGGRMSYTSSPGRGTVVNLTIPSKRAYKRQKWFAGSF